MSIQNFSIQDIVTRIMLTLPTKLTKEESSNVYTLFEGISSALQLSTDMVDELFRQTNLETATGAYVDEYITDLTGIGRKIDEEDSDYKERYRRNTFVYNCTKDGIRQIMIDINDEEPTELYSTGKRGAYVNARQFYNDTELRSTYGDASPTPFTGYIHLKQKPRESIMDELCKTINRHKAAGTKIYFFYPEKSFGYGNNGYGEKGYGE